MTHNTAQASTRTCQGVLEDGYVCGASAPYRMAYDCPNGHLDAEPVCIIDAAGARAGNGTCGILCNTPIRVLSIASAS